jgi:hypothetical protein
VGIAGGGKQGSDVIQAQLDAVVFEVKQVVEVGQVT